MLLLSSLLVTVVVASEEFRTSEVKHLADGSSLKRVRHFIDGFQVLGSGAVIYENNRHRVKRSERTNFKDEPEMVVDHVDRNFDMTSIERLRTISSDQSESKMACEKRLLLENDGAISKIDKITVQRMVVDRATFQLPTGSSGEPLVLADEVVLSGDFVSGNFFVFNCIFDATDGEVVLFWSGIRSFFGGNILTGPYKYGDNGIPHLEITDWNNGSCSFKDAAEIVEVFNAKSQLQILPSTTSMFNCSAGPNDGINGGYGPMADAFFNALQSSKMFLHSEWGTDFY